MGIMCIENGEMVLKTGKTKEAIEIFKEEVVKQNKSATIIEQDDGSIRMTIRE
jgi:ribosomal protein L4